MHLRVYRVILWLKAASWPRVAGKWANGVWAKVPLHIPAMSDNVMRLVFGEGKLDPRYQKFLDTFQVIIICVDENRKKAWEKSHFYRRCVEDRINVGFLQCPCVAKPIFNSNTGKYEYKETELWHLVTRDFWKIGRAHV